MAQAIGEKGEPTGAASPRYRIILIRRNFLVDLRDMVISSYRINLFYHNIELLLFIFHSLEEKNETTYIEGNFWLSFPFPSSSVLV